MNRIIKFRAWDSYQKEMYDWNEIVKKNSEGHLTLSNLLNNLIENIKPMQYTGLKDKHGKEVFEGDILEFDKFKWYRSAVLTQKDIEEKPSYYFEVYFDKHNGWCGAGSASEWDVYCEIIGNKYEHPNLIKK